MGRWSFLFIVIGLAAIGLGFTDFIQDDMKWYVISGGGALILLVFLFLWLRSKSKKKALMQQIQVNPQGPIKKYKLGVPAITDAQITEKKKTYLTSKEIRKLREAA